MIVHVNHNEGATIFAALLLLQRELLAQGDEGWAEIKKLLDENLQEHGHKPGDLLSDATREQMLAVLKRNINRIGFRLLEPDKLKTAIEVAKTRQPPKAPPAPKKKPVAVPAAPAGPKRTVVVKTRRPAAP